MLPTTSYLPRVHYVQLLPVLGLTYYCIFVICDVQSLTVLDTYYLLSPIILYFLSILHFLSHFRPSCERNCSLHPLKGA